MNQNSKKLVWLIAVFVIFFIMPVMAAPKVRAASLASKNKTAHKVLRKKYDKIYRKHMDISYKYFDVTGDGVHELLMDCYPTSGGGSGHAFYIFQAKNGKVKCILKTVEYGLERIAYYKKSKSLTMSMYGHGGESHTYYRFKSGKYKCSASKSRQSVKGGNMENGPWYYYNGSGKSISKSSFNKKTAGMKKGKARSTKATGWTYVNNPDFSW